MNGGGRRAPAPPQAPGPLPRPRLPAGSGSRTPPASETPHWLLRPPVKTEPGGGWNQSSFYRETSESQAHDLSWPPFSLPGGCPGDRDRHGLGPSPSRPSAARCGRMWRMWRPGHSSGRAPRGTRFLPFPGRSVLAAGGFIYAAKVRERLLHVRVRGPAGLSGSSELVRVRRTLHY